MRYKPLLADLLFSRLLGLVALSLLCPLMLCLARMVWLSSNRSGAIFCQRPLGEHPLPSVLLFNTRCGVRDFLRRYSLHSLPALMNVLQGQLTALEFAKIDWRAFR